jgi:alpha-L-fucosidase 2
MNLPGSMVLLLPDSTSLHGHISLRNRTWAMSVTRKIPVHCLFALIVTAALSAMAAADPGTTRLWYQQPATGFEQSLVLGNGRLGAMVFGGTDSERIILNEESVWSGCRMEHDIPGGAKYLPEIRRLLAEEKFAEANAVNRKAFQAQGTPQYGQKISPFGRYQTLGSLRLTFMDATAPVQEYCRELDLQTGLGTVAYRRGTSQLSRDHFVSAPDEVFVSRLTGPVSFTVMLDRPERFETRHVGDRELLMTGRLNNGFGNDGLTYVARLRVVGGRIEPEGDGLRVTVDDEVMLLVAAATDYRGIAGRKLEDPVAATAGDLDRAAGKSYAELRATQQADHARLFSRMALWLPSTPNSRLPTDQRLAGYRAGKPDPALAALSANMGRYLLISSSRPGGLPANLQGIWAEEVHTMWNGDYHFNINTQMNYWPALTSNLADLQEPLNTFVESLVEPGSKTAKAYYNSRGWIAHRLTNIWGYTSPAGMDIGGPAWLCEHLWEQYAFTLDQEFLARVYPVMKGSVEFYLDNLWEEPDHGWLVTGPSASPENGFLLSDGKTGSGICAGPTIDMQQLRELFANTMQAAAILGVDAALQEKLAEVWPRLAPNQIAPDGALQEWLKPYREREPTHRHCSPLYGLYPAYEITPEGTPELAEAARRLLLRRGVGQSTGWSNAWKINLWARLDDGQHAGAFVHQMLCDNTFDNLLSRFRPEGRKLFQIEANLGLTAGVHEMLLQSHPEPGSREPVIRLLPALPDAWPEGRVSGLAARGNFFVDIAWRDGRLAEAAIVSGKGGGCRVRYGDGTKTLHLRPGEQKTLTAADFTAADASRSKSSAQTADKPVLPADGGALPDLPDGTRLVFLGDSITDMKWGRNEQDRNHYLGHSFVFLLAARLGVDLSTTQLHFFNRGISGNTVKNLRDRWKKDAIALKPDILTILIGTNDVGIGLRHPHKLVTPAAFEQDYRHILQASRAANPALTIVLLDPFVLPVGRLKDSQAYRVRREATDQLRAVVARLAAEFDAVHINTQDRLDAAAAATSPDRWIWDGIHPLPSGHELLARWWLEAVSARWPKAAPH